MKEPVSRTRTWLRVVMRVGLVVIPAAGLMMTQPHPAKAGGVDKVTICHIPPGNPDNAHEITVGEPAVRAHLAHGDHVGPCTAPTPPPS
jgi:hypothetical protein